MKNLALWEKLAVRETGRPTVAVRETAEARLIVYPKRLGYLDILKSGEPGRNSTPFFLEYGSRPGRMRLLFRDLPVFLFRLIKILRACRRIDLYMLSPQADRAYVLAAASLCRLAGRSVTLHDYCFQSENLSRPVSMIYSICDGMVIGDVSAPADTSAFSPRLSAHIDRADPDFYRNLRKGRAVPRVIVYGDFSNDRIVTLAERAHDLVKQKYPRTEFVLASLTETPGSVSAGSVSIMSNLVKSEDDLRSLFGDGDILMLLSCGGLNRVFGRRAVLAGYPVITNGFEFSGEFSEETVPESVMAPKGSFSALAAAVIRAVDDELYYRSFARS